MAFLEGVPFGVGLRVSPGLSSGTCPTDGITRKGSHGVCPFLESPGGSYIHGFPLTISTVVVIAWLSPRVGSFRGSA